MRSYLINCCFLLFLMVFSSNSLMFAQEDVISIVAQSIWDSLPDQSPEFVNEFLRGMQEINVSMDEGELATCFEKETQAKEELVLKKQLQEANQFFFKIQKNKRFQEVIPQHVYFKTIKKGKGERVQDINVDIIASYSIKMSDGTQICFPNSEEERKLPLSGLLPGLAFGMVGMQKNEIREIFMHPKYGYIGMPFLEGNPYLIARVELKEIFLPREYQSFPVEPIELLVPEKSEKELAANYQRAHLEMAHQYGKAVWEHYKWSKFSLNEILSKIVTVQKQKRIDLNNKSFQEKLLDLHWLIYRNKETATFNSNEQS